MKARISKFSLRRREDIWWEDMKNIRDISEEDFTWSEFKRLFRRKYLA